MIDWCAEWDRANILRPSCLPPFWDDSTRMCCIAIHMKQCSLLCWLKAENTTLPHWLWIPFHFHSCTQNSVRMTDLASQNILDSWNIPNDHCNFVLQTLNKTNCSGSRYITRCFWIKKVDIVVELPFEPFNIRLISYLYYYL